MKAIEIQTPDGLCDAHIAYPAQPGTHPGVLFLMDAFGPRQYLYDMIQELADHGYVVLLPNLFYRQRQAPFINLPFPLKESDMAAARAEFMPLLQNFKAEDSVKDMAVFMEYLSQQKNCNGQFAATGYCMGGGLALRTAAKYPDLIQAVASFHAGRLASDAPDSPHLLLPKIKAKVYVAHADNDPHMTDEQISVFGNALHAAKIDGKAEKYEGASHGFTMLDLPPGNAAALKRHWDNLLEVLGSL